MICEYINCLIICSCMTQGHPMSSLHLMNCLTMPFLYLSYRIANKEYCARAQGTISGCLRPLSNMMQIPDNYVAIK